jgi:hypothetical protein
MAAPPGMSEDTSSGRSKEIGQPGPLVCMGVMVIEMPEHKGHASIGKPVASWKCQRNISIKNLVKLVSPGSEEHVEQPYLS